jgi:hypothetical protein
MTENKIETDLTFSLREVARAASVEESIIRTFVTNDVIKPLVRGAPGISHRFSAGQLYGIAHAIAWYARPGGLKWDEFARMVKHYEGMGQDNILTLCGLNDDDMRAQENLASAVHGEADEETLEKVPKLEAILDKWEADGKPIVAGPPWIDELMQAITYAHESASKAIRKKRKAKILEANRMRNFKA